ncbi:MAG: hypothetical protein JNK23_07065 [Opitutaceae bacterium]|nr:hypothetical protein [Opitutaceae bacterium]
MNKLSLLLAQRPALLRQVRLAHVAFAHATLATWAARIARARLSGLVTLSCIDPDQERFCATLVAHDGRQSLIEEHFTDEDVRDLAEVVAFVTCSKELEFTFELRELVARFLEPVQSELKRAGIVIDAADHQAGPVLGTAD